MIGELNILEQGPLKIRKTYRVPFYVSAFILIDILTIRVYDANFGVHGMNIIEPIFLLVFACFIVERFYLVKTFNASFGNIYFIFVLYGLFNVVLSTYAHKNDGEAALAQFRRICFYPIMFYIGYNYFTDLRHLQLFTKIIHICTIILFPLAVFYYFIGFAREGGYLQFFQHYEGWVSSYIILYSLSRYIMEGKTSISFLTKMLTLGSIFIIILTNRRGLWISVFITLFVVYYLSARKVSFVFLFRVLLIVGLVIGSIVAAVKIFDPNGQNFLVAAVEARLSDTETNLEDPTQLGQGEGGSLAFRLSVYPQSAKYIAQYPIFGIGLGFQPVFLIPRDVNSDEYRAIDDKRFHNIFLEILVETGAVGLSIFLLMHGTFVYKVFKARKYIPIEAKPHVVAMFGIYFEGLIWGTGENNFISNTNFILIVYLVIGIVSKQLYIIKNERYT